MKPDLNKKPLGGKSWRQRKLTLERPGQPLDYDCPQAMVEEMSAWLEERAGAAQPLPGLGREAMVRLMELADGKHRDRTGEMIDLVARSTGISFPHVLQRYLELFLLSTRLAKGYAITASNTRRLALEVQGCRMAGKDSSCRDFCLPAFQEAAARAGLEASMEFSRRGPEGPCGFSISPLSG